MKLYALIGTLALMGFTVSCATDLEQVAPNGIVEDVPGVVVEPSLSVDSEPEDVASVDSEQPSGESAVPDSASDPGRASASTQTAPPAPAVTSDSGDTGDPPNPPPGISEPSVPEIPEPGGPWIDPGEPDFTKTVPPPRD